MQEIKYLKPLKISELATQDRPREKLINKGRGALTNAELLGILIGSGVQQMSAVDLAQHILKAYDNDLHTLAQLSVEDLKGFKGIGDAKAVTIVSAMELASRLIAHEKLEKKAIDTSEKAYNIMKQELTGKLVEEFWVLLLNQANKLVKKYQVSKGGLSKTVVDVRMIFKAAFANQATGIILVHNHPSGNLKPSQADIMLTQKLARGSALLSLRILDHVIFTDRNYFSFADEGILD